jgi:hypothetical protein
MESGMSPTALCHKTNGCHAGLRDVPGSLSLESLGNRLRIMWQVTCASPMRIISFITQPDVITRILDHIGQPTRPPPLAPAVSLFS